MRASARSSSSVALRVASTVVAIPPASYGAPAIRAANSSARSPANTRWVWLSTNPGITHRPPASIRSSPAAPARSIAITRPSSITSAASRTAPNGPRPARSHVTSSPIRCRAPALLIAGIACPQLGSDVARWCTVQLPAADDDTSRRRRAWRRRRPRPAHPRRAFRPGAAPSSRTVTKSASAPGSIRPPSGQPRLA